jgi:hypothetical protein
VAADMAAYALYNGTVGAPETVVAALYYVLGCDCEQSSRPIYIPAKPTRPRRRRKNQARSQTQVWTRPGPAGPGPPPAAVVAFSSLVQYRLCERCLPQAAVRRDLSIHLSRPRTGWGPPAEAQVQELRTGSVTCLCVQRRCKSGGRATFPIAPYIHRPLYM